MHGALSAHLWACGLVWENLKDGKKKNVKGCSALLQPYHIPVPAASPRIAPASTSSCPAPPSAASPLQPPDLPDSSDAHKIFSNHQHQLIKLNNQIIVRDRALCGVCTALNALLGLCLLQYCCLRNTQVKYKFTNCLKILYLWIFAGCLVPLLAKAACFKSWLWILGGTPGFFHRGLENLSCSSILWCQIGSKVCGQQMQIWTWFGGFFFGVWLGFLEGCTVLGFFLAELAFSLLQVGCCGWCLMIPRGCISPILLFTLFISLVVFVGGNRWVHW